MHVQDILDSFYGAGQEQNRFSTKHGFIEFFITTSYIERYLKRGDRILEVGCGTGAYTLHYAHQGYEVDAIDLVEANLAVLQQNMRSADRVRAVQGNALDLSQYVDQTFDITLLLGPMYHLYTTNEKLQCLQEALRVTKTGGILFVAYCQFDASMIQAGFIRHLYDDLVEKKLLDTQWFLPISNPEGIFELYRKEQIDALNEKLNCQRLHYVGTDMFSHYYEEEIDSMEDTLYQNYIAYTASICENEHLVGVSNHSLDVLQRY